MNGSLLPLIYALPAIIALCCKVGFLYQLRTRPSSYEGSAFTLLCCIMVLHNMTEVSAYILVLFSEQMAYAAADIYMCLCYCMLSSIVFFSMHIAQRPHALIYVLLIMTPLMLCILHSQGDVIASWTRVGDHALVSSPGLYYIVFRIFLLASIAYSLYILYQASRTPEHNAKARIAFIGLLPLTLSMAGVILLKLMGFNASTAMILPIGTLFFLAAAWISSKRTLFDASEVITLRLALLIDLLFRRSKPMAQLIDDYERQLLLDSFNQSNGTQVDMARILGVSEATITRRLKKHGYRKTENNGQVQLQRTVQTIED